MSVARSVVEAFTKSKITVAYLLPAGSEAGVSMIAPHSGNPHRGVKNAVKEVVGENPQIAPPPAAGIKVVLLRVLLGVSQCFIQFRPECIRKGRRDAFIVSQDFPDFGGDSWMVADGSGWFSSPPNRRKKFLMAQHGHRTGVHFHLPAVNLIVIGTGRGRGECR